MLAAILFTDIVDSTEIAKRLGDVRWKELIKRHHAIVRRELKRFGGRELDTAGDGFFARFAEPAAAIRCACSAADSLRELGIEIRAGIHFGECEQIGGKVGGLTVVVAARVMSLGGAGVVSVTSTVRELVGGAGFGFDDLGSHRLKGLDGTWQVLAVSDVDDVPRPGRLAPTEAEARLADIRPGPGRRRTWVIVGATLVVLGAVVVAMVRLRGDGAESGGFRHVPPDRIGVIDPETVRIDSIIDVGSTPTAVVFDQRVLWVASLPAGTVTRVDLASGELRHVSTGGHPAELALEEDGDVWVLNGFEGTVIRIDPSDLVADQPIQLPIGTRDLAVGSGAVWVTNADDRSLTRIDLVTEALEVIDLPHDVGAPMGVAADDQAVWIAGSRGVAMIEQGSRTEPHTWALRAPAESVALSDGTAWVSQFADDLVTRIDVGGGPTAFTVGNGPVDLAIGYGAVWVTNGLDGTLSRIDQQTNDVQTIRVGGSPEGIDAGGGSVWVAVRAA
jgi:streptogramin lyase